MINWKVRIKNAHFWVQVALSILMPTITYFGLTAKDLTTWGAVFELIKDAVLNPYVVVTIIVSVYNAIIDPTTKGISDSTQAMTYDKPKI